MIEVYTRQSCPACTTLKATLSDKGIFFTERVIDLDIPTVDVQRKFPDSKHLPILAVGFHVLGGVDELQALIDNDQLKYLLNL